MITFLRVRFQGMRLGRKLRRSILADQWVPGNTPVAPVFGGEVTRGCSLVQPRNGEAEYEVTIQPRRFRLFDRVNLYYRGHEVWLPLLTRIRVRNAVRFWFQKKAKYALWAR